MRPLVPFFEHWRGTIFPVLSPRPASGMTPAPARTPEKEAEGSQGGEEEEQQDQEAEEPEAKAEGAMERHTIPISIVGIWRRGRFSRGGFDGDRRALGNTRPKGEEGDACDRGDQH